MDVARAAPGKSAVGVEVDGLEKVVLLHQLPAAVVVQGIHLAVELEKSEAYT